MLSRTATGRRIAAATLAVTGALSALAGTAGASVTPRPATSLTGADLSWPQCPAGMGTAERPTKGLPGPNADATFVVLGLTNGPAFTPNPCLPAQTKAQQAAHRWTAAYSVVSYPTSAQLSEYGQAGPYRGNDLFTRLRNVGWSQAQFNLATMKVAGLRSPIVWIDVEPVPGHPWGSTGANNAVIDGVVAGYRHGGFATGFYSYANGWNQITGGRRDSSPTWVPGLPTRSTALARCYQRSFSGGPTVIGQWYDGTGDFDVTCPWVAGPAPTPSPLARYQNTTLAYGSRGFAVQALQRAIGVTPSGFYGTWTQATVAKVQRAHHLPVTGVVTQSTWLALGAGTLRGGSPNQMGRYFAAS